ncbi:MAG: MFS transporter [Chloroflexota bacterium]
MARPFASELWRNGAFVRIWSAATISIFGSLVSGIALPFVAILILDAGPTELALLRSLDLGIGLAVGLVAGVWVDRLRRRRVLVWADLGRAVLLGSIPAAWLLGVLAFWQLLVVTAAAAILTAFFDAADNAYLPTVVERERIVEANAALRASGSAAEFTAFGIGGVLVQVFSAPLAILLDAVSFLGSALLLATIRRPEAAAPPPGDRAPVVEEIREGVRLVASDPVLRAFTLAEMALGGLWGFFGATWLLFATEELGLGPAAIGIVAGVGGAAAFLGAVMAERSVRRFGLGPAAIGALVLTAVGNALIPIAPAGLPLVALMCLVGQQLIGDSAATVFEVTAVSVRQVRVRDRAQGRVASTVRVASGAAQLATTLAGGLIGAAIGLRAAMIIGPIAGLVGAAILWASPVRRLQEIDVAVPNPIDVVAEVTRDEPLGG